MGSLKILKREGSGMPVPGRFTKSTFVLLLLLLSLFMLCVACVPFSFQTVLCGFVTSVVDKPSEFFDSQMKTSGPREKTNKSTEKISVQSHLSGETKPAVARQPGGHC